MQRGVVAVVVLVVAVGADLVGAPPAGADGAGPTNFESVLDAVDPPDDRVEVDVVGGDAFLRVRAERGTAVEIAGYDGEPYLRIDEDGTVWRNERSAATYLNLSRDGTGIELPEEVDSRGEPRWVAVGDDGEVAWHDHRIHWMIDQAPGVGEDRLVQRWSVPIVVDGDEVEISGRLLLHPDELGWAVALLALAVLTALGAVWRSARCSPDARARWLVGGLLGASGLALVVAVGAHVVNPPDAGAGVLGIALPAVALAASVGVLVAPRLARSSPVATVLPLAAIAALAGWVVARVGVTWMPILPTVLPSVVDRVGTALVAGVAIGAAIAVVRDPAPRVSTPFAP